MAPPKIAIIGAGPAGLTLARLLQQNCIPCSIYEGDENKYTRNQGGTLDLHPNTGQRALREAGLFGEFQKHSRPEGQASKLVRYDGHVFWDENKLDLASIKAKDVEDRPEIDRVALREILLKSVNPASIKWGHRVTRVEADPRKIGKTIVHFIDGTKESDIDLLVGADGAWSKVRPLVTDTKPFYSGISCAELWSFTVDENNPWLSKYVGSGQMFMFDEGRCIAAQRNGDDSIRVYGCVRQPEDWSKTCGINWLDHDAAREALVKQYFDNCSEDLKRVILSCRDELIIRQLFMLPVGLTWEHCPDVTLLGDAAHLMTPFAGVGVNCALTDAMVLAKELVSKKDGFVAKAFSHRQNISSAVRKYETAMFEFSKDYAEKTAQGLKGHFSKDGAKDRADIFLKLLEKKTGKRLDKDKFN